ncbi:phagocyte signaling impaired isoform X2 [Oratosquilla oratoria]|uniref:phagocyte signaling impaired isoform X2 n=1 Tax=Oratosquilla oratoria TaxID=337810 RepID=UPI003F76132F
MKTKVVPTFASVMRFMYSIQAKKRLFFIQPQGRARTELVRLRPRTELALLRPRTNDWLDSGNNKKALQEADKVLKKQPNFLCAKVLKGLALLRLGRNAECEHILASVVGEIPTDEATLQAITICYREMHQPEQICRVYENAVKVDPNNEELLSHLFMAHVRVGEYKKQQQAAMQLYKLKPKNPYYFWAVTSIVMQAHKSNDAMAQKVSLPLAEKMVAKFVAEGKIEVEAEVLLYLHILEMQEKYAEAQEVLNGPLASKILHQPQNFIALKRGLYYSKLKDWENMHQVYKTLIKEEPDNWNHYIEFVGAAMELAAQDADSNSLEEETAKFLEEVRETEVTNDSKNRGPHFALLQLALALSERGRSHRIEELCEKPSEILYKYVCKYGDKMCCFGDIVNFLQLITEQEVPQFLERVRALICLPENGVPEDILSIYRHLTWLQLQRYLGAQEKYTPEEHMEFANSLVSLYHHTAHLSADMATTDIRPNDGYLILASHSFMQALNRGCSDPTQILTMAAVLEHGSQVSKANFQLKLVLIHLYNLIGASNASHSVYERLDLKHIQLDTLSHVLALQALDSANYSVAGDIFAATLRFFMANYKDTSDPLISSYKYGSLTRIPEFVEFRERLSNSLHFATVTAEQMLLDLTLHVSSQVQLLEVIQQMDIDPTKDKVDWSALRDNRDLKVINSWEPKHGCLQESEREESFTAEVAMLKLRNLILRTIGAATKLTLITNNADQTSSNKENSGCMNGETSENGDYGLLKDLLAKLEKENELCNKYCDGKAPKYPLQGPDSPRVYLYMKGGFVPVIIKHVQLVQHICVGAQDVQGLDNLTRESVKQSSLSMEMLIGQHSSHLDAIITCSTEATPDVNSQALAFLSHLLQTVGVVCVLLGCCHHVLKPIKAAASKKKKKKKEGVAMPEVMSLFSGYVSSLSLQLQKWEKSISEVVKACQAASEAMQKSGHQLNITCELPDLDVSGVCEKVDRSAVVCLEKLGSAVTSKIKYLSSLKL